MTVLYVVSAEEAAGKTALCSGLGKYLQSNGRNVGYLKLAPADNNVVDGDSGFLKEILDLAEAAESLCLPSGDVEKIKEVYSKGDHPKDVVIIEGILGSAPNDKPTRTSCEIARALAAKVIVIEVFSGQIGRFIDTYKEFGTNLLGVILNKIPVSQIKRVQDEAAGLFGLSGIKVLGCIPENRALMAITVSKLADSIQGKILTGAEKSTELVENYMLGAMVVDSGADYFGRKSHKAAVVRQERPDLQLAALETSTTCLILSGSKPPVPRVLLKAKNQGIPIIASEAPINNIMASIEEALQKSRFNQGKKMPILIDIMMQYLDLKDLEHKISA